MRQVLLYFTIILAVLVLAITSGVARLSHEYQVREYNRIAAKTQGMLNILATIVADDSPKADLGLLRTAASRVLEDPEIAGLQILDEEGFPLIHRPPRNPHAVVPYTVRIMTDQSSYPATSSLWFSEAQSAQRVRAFRQRAAWGGAFVGSALLLPLAWVFGCISLVLRQTREAVHPVASGDLNHLVQGKMSGEFLDLRDSINGIIQHLRASHYQTQLSQQRMAFAENRVHELIEEARRTEALLYSSERGLKAIFDQSPYWMGMLKTDGTIQSLNHGFTDYLGGGPDAFTNKPFWELPLFDNETTRQNSHADFQSALGGKVAVRSSNLSDRSGRPHHIEYTLKPVFDEDKKVWKVLLLAHEVTSQVLAEQEIKEREAQVQQAQKMDALGQLAGGIAHDFNNLLTSILGFSQMVMDALPADMSARKDLREVIHSAERAKNLTQKLLNLARKRSERIEPTDLNLLIRNAEKLIRLTVHDNIEYIPKLNDDIGLIDIDPVSVEQILLNLAVNARDAMPRSGRFYIRTQPFQPDEEFLRKHKLAPGKYVDLTVRDTGCGMPPEILPRIFEPFFTTKEPGQGTGLGLSTAYNIVRQYKGTITVESRPGAGTEFHIYFPVIENYVPVNKANPSVPQPLPTGKETLLLVEDEDALRRMGTRLIESLGYTVYAAKDGQEGLEVFRSHLDEIRLVITDVVMPIMSGPDMIRRMRGARKDIRFLFVSGFTADKLSQHGVGHLEGSVIPKPYSKETLARRIREELDR